MKKKIKLIIKLLLIISMGFLGFKIATKLNHKKEVAQRTKTIPDFSFKTLSGATFTKQDLSQKPTIFIYFNSECEYCQSEATKIHERLADFKQAQLVFVSFEPREGIHKFAQEYQLDQQENILFLEDVKGEFSKIFDVNSIPYIVVYNKNQELLKKFKGATKIDTLLEVLK